MAEPAFRDFFISYCAENEVWARWVVCRLEDSGYTCWAAFRDFHGDFKEHMQEGLLHCRFTLALLSRQYLDSSQCASEWRAAMDAGKLVVARVEDVQPPGLLRTLIHVNLHRQEEAVASAQLLSHLRKRIAARSIRDRADPVPSAAAPFPRQAAASPQHAETTHDRPGISRRAVLVGIGAVAAGGTGVLAWRLREPSLSLQTIKRWKSHAGIIWDIAVSGDGQHVLSGSHNGALVLWRLSTGELVRRFEGHERSVLAVAFSPDGREIASGSADGSASLWRTLSGARIRRVDTAGRSVRALAYMQDGTALFLAAGNYSNQPPLVWMMDTKNGRELQRFEGHEDAVEAIALTHDGKRLLTGSADRTARLWEISSAETLKVLEGHRGGIATVAVRPDGKQAVTGSGNLIPADHALRLWDLQTGKQEGLLEGHEDALFAARFTADGRHVLSASADQSVRLWKVATRTDVARMTELGQKASSLALSPIGTADGRDVVVGDYEGIITHARLVSEGW
jgi:hypothetical protein